MPVPVDKHTKNLPDRFTLFANERQFQEGTLKLNLKKKKLLGYGAY